MRRRSIFRLLCECENRLLGEKEISIGSLNAAPVDMKEALKWGIRYKAYGLILVHNHPSGDPSPSREDISLTGNLPGQRVFWIWKYWIMSSSATVIMSV